MGNLICVREGKGPRVMLAAHMDEIGLMVKSVEDNGFIRFTRIGGVRSQLLPGRVAVIRTSDGKKIEGVIHQKPVQPSAPGQQPKPPRIEDLFIDVGASNKEEVEGLGIKPGDPVVLKQGFTVVNGKVAVGKAMDDRTGCLAMALALKLLKDEDIDAAVYAVGTVQEEVGVRGATTAAYTVKPDFAIALDVTLAQDIPGASPAERVTSLGKGPAVKLMDTGIVVNPRIRDFIARVAEEEKIPYQPEILTRGGTDAYAIHLSRAGVLTGVISIPTRYVHSPTEMISIDDLVNTARLVAAVIRRVDRDVIAKLTPS